MKTKRNIKGIFWALFVNILCFQNVVSAQDTTLFNSKARDIVASFYENPKHGDFFNDKIRIDNHIVLGGVEDYSVAEYVINIKTAIEKGKGKYKYLRNQTYLTSPYCCNVTYRIDGKALAALIVFDDKSNPYIAAIYIHNRFVKEKEKLTPVHKASIIKMFEEKKLTPLKLEDSKADELPFKKTFPEEDTRIEDAKNIVASFYNDLHTKDAKYLMTYFEDEMSMLFNHILLDDSKDESGLAYLKVSEYINNAKRENVSIESIVEATKYDVKHRKDCYIVNTKLVSETRRKTSQVGFLLSFQSGKGKIFWMDAIHSLADKDTYDSTRIVQLIGEVDGFYKNKDNCTAISNLEVVKKKKALLENYAFEYRSTPIEAQLKKSIRNASTFIDNVPKLEKKVFSIAGDKEFKKGKFYKQKDFFGMCGSSDNAEIKKSDNWLQLSSVFKVEGDKIKVLPSAKAGTYTLRCDFGDKKVDSNPFKITYKYSRWIHVSVGVGAATLGYLIYQFTRPAPPDMLAEPPAFGGK